MRSTTLAAGLCGAAEQGQLDYSATIFATMAAYEAGNGTADAAPADPLRASVRRAVLAKNPPVLSDLKRFFYEHRKPDPGSRSRAVHVLRVSGGKSLRDSRCGFPGGNSSRRAGSAGFRRTDLAVYSEAGIEAIWKQVQPQYERALEQYQEPVTHALLETNGYLAESHQRVYGPPLPGDVDLLAPSSQVHTRSYKDDYFIVVTPPASTHIDDVRHAYLHYLLDPLATKYFQRFERVRGLLDYAQGAPALEESYKSDFLLLGTGT